MTYTLEPVYRYLNGKDPIIVDGEIAVHENGKEIFRVQTAGNFQLPVLLHGKTWHIGWDIPTRWAIDANKICWRDNAHGHSLEPIPTEQFIRFLDLENDQGNLKCVRQILGIADPEAHLIICPTCSGKGKIASC